MSSHIIMIKISTFCAHSHTFFYFIINFHFVHLLKYTYHGVSTKFYYMMKSQTKCFLIATLLAYCYNTPYYHYRQFTFSLYYTFNFVLTLSLHGCTVVVVQRHSKRENVKFVLAISMNVLKYNLNFFLFLDRSVLHC